MDGLKNKKNLYTSSSQLRADQGFKAEFPALAASQEQELRSLEFLRNARNAQSGSQSSRKPLTARVSQDGSVYRRAGRCNGANLHKGAWPQTQLCCGWP